MLVPIPYVHAGLGAATVLAALPLALGKVPMNRAYGFRLEKAFRSQDNWRALNIYGGKCLLVSGLLLLLFGILAKDLAPPPESPLAVPWLLAPLVLIGGWAGLRIRAFAGRLPDR